MISVTHNRQAQQVLFTTIQHRLQCHFSQDYMCQLKTKSGNTQVAERSYIHAIGQVLNQMGLSYKVAGSQQSKDFRNVGGIGLDIEVKKTDSKTIYFNDTCPTDQIWYIIIFSGKTYKTKNKTDIPAQTIFLNGGEFIRDSPWLVDYQKEIELLKDKYARGANKKGLEGIMEVYPRPTYKASIEKFLNLNLTLKQ